MTKTRSPASAARRLCRGAVLVALLVGACGEADRAQDGAAEPLTVFAAASLRDVMLEQAREYRRLGGRELEFNFAGSNVLALQLEASPGAADVFLSADSLWVEYLERAGLVRSESTVRFLSNQLVVVAATTSPLAFAELGALASADVRYLAIGHPEAVPAGRYARAALERVAVDSGPLWSQVEERIAPAADVRAVLALVEARDDTVGIVYRTDALSSTAVRSLLEIPGSSTPPIGYFAAVTRESEHIEAATELVEYLAGEEARPIFERHGFDVPVVPRG